MTGAPRPCPVADGGTHHATLFESFPDPLLAYAIEPDSNAGEGSLVVRRVNAAFERSFGVDSTEIAGTSLDGVVLAGAVVPARDATDATANTDPSDPEPDDTTGTTGNGEAVDDAGTTGSAPTTTVGSLLHRARDAGHDVRFDHERDGETRNVRVRAVTGTDETEGGYLLFADVTDLERPRRDAEARLSRLERIVRVARHDLRNPLEVAKIRLEAARDTGEDVHFEKVVGALDRIEHIVENALVVGGGAVEPTGPVALEAVAEAAWETVDTGDATLVVSAGLPTVRGDADRLRGLFENLFRNSVEHGSTCSRPEADDSVEHGGPNVTVRVEPHSEGFVVADDGPGIPEGIRDHVFEAGYSTTPDNSGLGLSIVEQVAREHGWRVSLASDRESSSTGDGGARFEFSGVDRAESDTDGSDGPS